MSDAKFEYEDQCGDSIRIWQVKNGAVVFHVTGTDGHEIAVVIPPEEIPKLTSFTSSIHTPKTDTEK